MFFRRFKVGFSSYILLELVKQETNQLNHSNDEGTKGQGTQMIPKGAVQGWDDHEGGEFLKEEEEENVSMKGKGSLANIQIFNTFLSMVQ